MAKQLSMFIKTRSTKQICFNPGHGNLFLFQFYIAPIFVVPLNLAPY